MQALTPALKRNINLEIPQGHLRPLRPEDVHPGYVDGLNNPDVNKYLVNVRQRVQTLETVRAFVNADHLAADAVLFGIWIDGQTRHCGTVRLHMIDREEGTAVLGICIFDKQAWGRTLGSAAISVVTQWAFVNLCLDTIEAGAYSNNVGSWKAFLKAGYEVAEDVCGRYELDGKPTVVRKMVAHRAASGSASRNLE